MDTEKKKSIIYYSLSTIGCFVAFFLLITIFGGEKSNGNRLLVNLGVVLIFAGIFSIIRLLIILFSKEKK